MEQALAERGFTHTTNDEPAEDYWTLEMLGRGTDLLVEETAGKWDVARSPRNGENQGEWVSVARWIEADLALSTVDLLIAGLDRDDDRLVSLRISSDDVEACALFYEALGLMVTRTETGGDRGSIVVDTGGMQLEIHPSSSADETSRGIVIELAVHDPVARAAHALSTLSSSRYAHGDPACLRDPDGRVVRLRQARG